MVKENQHTMLKYLEDPGTLAAATVVTALIVGCIIAFRNAYINRNTFVNRKSEKITDPDLISKKLTEIKYSPLTQDRHEEMSASIHLH